MIVRPGGVYGALDQVVTLFFRILRASPVAPVVSGGQQRWQPCWCDDLGEALAACATRDDVEDVYEVAGEEVVTTLDLYERVSRLVGRRFVPFSVPARAAVPASRLLHRLGIAPPLNDAKLDLLMKDSVIEPPDRNALAGLLGRRPVSLDEGLRRMADDSRLLTGDDERSAIRQARMLYASYTLHEERADLRGARCRPPVSRGDASATAPR